MDILSLSRLQFAFTIAFHYIYPEFSLTINAASSQKTLQIILTIALIGMPIVIAYTASIYWIFRGKVKALVY